MTDKETPSKNKQPQIVKGSKEVRELAQRVCEKRRGTVQDMVGDLFKDHPDVEIGPGEKIDPREVQD